MLSKLNDSDDSAVVGTMFFSKLLPDNDIYIDR